jgi:hypothetical protein
MDIDFNTVETMEDLEAALDQVKADATIAEGVELGLDEA